MGITEQDVKEYRDFYYGFVKPILTSRSILYSEKDERCKAIIETLGWTEEKFRAFQMIDLSQRIAKRKSKEMMEKGVARDVRVRVDDEEISDIQVSALPELKCPIRTEQKD